MPFLAALIPVAAEAGAVGAGAATAGTAAAGAAATGGWLSTVMTGLSVAGLGMNVLGQMQQGSTEAKIMEANADAQRMEAVSAQDQAKAETLRMSRQSRKMIGAQSAIFGGAGLDMSGSPLDVMADTAANYEADIQNLGYAGDVKAASKNFEASIYDWAAPLKEQAGMIAAGGTLLSGTSALMRSKKYGPPSYGYGV